MSVLHQRAAAHGFGEPALFADSRLARLEIETGTDLGQSVAVSARNVAETPPQTYTGQAINDLAADWPRLIRYLDDGRD